LILRDSTQPTYAGCGGCLGAPTFGGVVSAVDNDGCGGPGITLSWLAAPSWGSGTGGTYNVYRDTTSGFTPGLANLVASGVAGPTWTDVTAPADTAVYYVVRAENDETCGTGPSNGGLMDANSVEIMATDATSQMAPGNVGETLWVDPVNKVHARLTWAAATHAADYRVYRSSMADSGFAVVAQPVEPIYEDAGVLGDGESWFYLITAADACGNESSE
jgi:hypothetical protein